MKFAGRFWLWAAFLLPLLCPTTELTAELQLVPGHVPVTVSGLQPLGKLPPTNIMHLAIGLPLRNREDLTNFLQRVYDTGSPNFHQYLTPDQFAEKFGPASENYEALANFITANGLKVIGAHSNRMLLDVSGSVADIEKLLHLRLRTYRHPTEARAFFAPDAEPSLALAVPILHISGLDNYLRPKPTSLHAPSAAAKNIATPATGSAPGGSYMGNDFRAAYVPGTTLTGVGQIVGLLEFDGYFPSDVAAYRALASLPAIPLKNVLLDGFDGSPGVNNTEVSLDIDMASSMAPGLSAIIVYEGETTDDILYRMATDNLAKQLSASWTYPIDATSEQIFQQFAAQGQSFFNASGDSDAYSAANPVPTPTDDPNITVVGGTTLSTSGPGGAWVSEKVWNWGSGTGGGGGISTTYPIPSWQQGVSMASNDGSTNMRNLPDVALTADGVWLIYNDGAAGEFGGTSCATPLWAAFTALVNQQALANGKSTMGFINPAIYALGESTNYNSVFHDMTNGNNTSSASPSNFFAVPGYDLCTGWGTPNGTNLINALAPLDALRISPPTGFTAAAGGVGGPFTATNQIYILTNAGTNLVKWSAGTSATWLSFSITGGTLLPGGPANVVAASLNAAASNLVAGAYSALVYFTNLNDGLALSRSFSLDILAVPVITTPPTNQVVLGGATVIFSAQVIGGLPLSYQWQQNGIYLTDGGNITGSSTTSLTLDDVTFSNVGAYTIVASNAAVAVTSAPPAFLTIIPSLPVITLQPVSQYAMLGATANFTVAALGNAPLAYQWQCNGTNLSDSGGIAGSSTSSLTLSNVTSGSAGTYTAVVSNILGAVTSSNAVFTVYALSDTELMTNGGFETGNFFGWNLSGNSVFDTVGGDPFFAYTGLFGAEMGAIGSLGYISQTVATIPGAAYLLSFWFDSPDGAAPNEFFVSWNGYTLFDQTNLSAFGWTNFQFVVTATETNTTVEFGVRDDASFLGLDDVSLKPLLNPGGAPVITAQPPPLFYVAAGQAASLTVAAAGQLPLFYQWQSNAIPIPEATNATLSWQDTSTNQAAVYDVVVSNSLGVAISSNVTLAVAQGSLELVTFDDLGSTNAPVPNGYASVDWSNFYTIDTALSAPNPSGYLIGTISQPNGAFNNYGTAAFITNSTPFSFLSAWFTAAWNNDLRLEIKGYASNTLAYDQAFNLSATNPTLLNVNCIGVTNMEFITSGGYADTNYGGSGTEFVMDNASVLINPGSAPTNDACASAIVIDRDPFTNIQSNLGATSAGDPAPACMANFTNGVWYEFTPSAGGEIVVSTMGSDFAAGAAIYSGACGSFIPVACGAGTVTAAVLGGTNYYILAGALQNITGTLVFELNYSSSNAGPPVILAQPANVTVVSGATATFSVTAEGAQPLNYFWRCNGTTIAGATNASYSAGNVQLTSSGSLYSCVVSNSVGVTNSSSATLTVTPLGQLVQNGGFETGDFTDWTLSGNTADTYVNTYFVHSGNFGAALGPYGSLGYMSQSLPVTAGQVYLLSLWLDVPGVFTPNEFSVQWNGTTFFDQVNLIAPLGWTNLQFIVPATTTNAVLKIGFRDDPYFLGLDDITVFPLRPVLQDVTAAGSTLNFDWSALPGYTYQIQSSTNLSQTNWTALGAPIAATNYIMSTAETNTSSSLQFYRIVLLP